MHERGAARIGTFRASVSRSCSQDFVSVSFGLQPAALRESRPPTTPLSELIEQLISAQVAHCPYTNRNPATTCKLTLTPTPTLTLTLTLTTTLTLNCKPARTVNLAL